MKLIKRLPFLTLILIVLISTACKKIKTPVIEPKPATEEPESKPNEPTKKILVPVKFESAALTLEIKYTENIPLISELTFSSGIKYVFKYSNQIPVKLDRYLNGTKNYSADYLISNGIITRVSQFEIFPSQSNPLEKYYLEYNSRNQISVIKNHAVSNVLIQTRTLSYGSDGNLTSLFVEKTDKTNFLYTYDTKSGIFSSVKFAQVLQLELPYQFLTSGPNNLIRFSGGKKSDDRDYTYTYNTDNYPASLTLKTQSGTQTFKISYIELK
ncbi:hypothetical protein ACVWYN_001807 [Pedobacter sp. UYP24]